MKTTAPSESPQLIFKVWYERWCLCSYTGFCSWSDWIVWLFIGTQIQQYWVQLHLMTGRYCVNNIILLLEVTPVIRVYYWRIYVDLHQVLILIYIIVSGSYNIVLILGYWLVLRPLSGVVQIQASTRPGGQIPQVS